MPLGSRTQAITLNKQWVAYISSVSVCMDMIERGEWRGRMDLTSTILSLGGNAEQTVFTDWFRSALSPLKEPGVSGCGLMFFTWQWPRCCAVGTLRQQSCITSKTHRLRQLSPFPPASLHLWASFCQEGYFVEGMELGWFPGLAVLAQRCSMNSLTIQKQLNHFTFHLFKWPFAVVWAHWTF